jgi:hypothetical protein
VERELPAVVRVDPAFDVDRAERGRAGAASRILANTKSSRRRIMVVKRLYRMRLEIPLEDD